MSGEKSVNLVSARIERLSGTHITGIRELTTEKGVDLIQLIKNGGGSDDTKKELDFLNKRIDNIEAFLARIQVPPEEIGTGSGEGTQGPQGPAGPPGPRGPAGSIGKISLKDISDVDLSGAEDNAILVFNKDRNKWVIDNGSE